MMLTQPFLHKSDINPDLRSFRSTTIKLIRHNAVKYFRIDEISRLVKQLINNLGMDRTTLQNPQRSRQNRTNSLRTILIPRQRLHNTRRLDLLCLPFRQTVNTLLIQQTLPPRKARERVFQAGVFAFGCSVDVLHQGGLDDGDEAAFEFAEEELVEFVD